MKGLIGCENINSKEFSFVYVNKDWSNIYYTQTSELVTINNMELLVLTISWNTPKNKEL